MGEAVSQLVGGMISGLMGLKNSLRDGELRCPECGGVAYFWDFHHKYANPGFTQYRCMDCEWEAESRA